MIDKWFVQDIEHILQHSRPVVIFDPGNLFGFLLPLLESKGYQVIRTDYKLTETWQMVKEELDIRCRVESFDKNDQAILYITREKSRLSFLFDYCATRGCLDLSPSADWLKRKLFTHTGLQVQMDGPVLLTAAKLSLGKDIHWWKKILQNLQDLICLDEELLPFLHEPDKYLKELDSDVRRLFEEKLFELIEQPYMAKPPQILATEVVKKLLDGLAYNNVSSELVQQYYRWVDSSKYRSSLQEYISHYELDETAEPWSAHADHCFLALDLIGLRHLVTHLGDEKYLEEKKQLICKRMSGKAHPMVPSWWQDVLTILDYEGRSLTSCTTLDQVVTFYCDEFAGVDRALRNLYAQFLQEKEIIQPLQEYYEGLNYELLHHWYDHTKEYRSDQTGYLTNLFQDAQPGIAVIVGDGMRYEMADFVSSHIGSQIKCEKGIMLADLPSDTENNMSALYTEQNTIISSQQERGTKLKEASHKNITFMNLEELHPGIDAEYLLLTYKDIDSAGEKLQQGALKLFEEFENVLIEKIKLLLNSGYREVHLLTDHGFVLTGLLTESDKIDPNVTGPKQIHERFVRTVDRQKATDWIEFAKPYNEFNYVYVAKSHRPFKSKGVYGFSHGGFTPQEIILPKFVFRKEKVNVPGLAVTIINKKDLEAVTGERFGIKIRAAGTEPDLFTANRKIQILLFAGSANYSSSQIITMLPGKSESMEFSFNGNPLVSAVLIDAETQEQLDIVRIKKSNARDLSGLL